MKKTEGQSLGEYGLAAALVAIVGIGACLYVTETVGSALPGLTDRIFGGGGGSMTVNIPNAGQEGTGAIGGRPGTAGSAQGDSGLVKASGGSMATPVVAASAYGYATEPECFDGVCVNLPVFTAVETAGGMGSQGTATKKMANVMQELAQALDNDPAVPADVVRRVTALANKGHEMAEVQQWLADPSGKGCSGKNNRCSGKGAKRFSSYIQKKDRLTAEFQQLHKDLGGYLSSHPKALANYPDAASIINFQANEIVKVSKSMKTESTQGFRGSGWVSLKKGDYKLTRQSANTICDNGGDGPRCRKKD